MEKIKQKSVFGGLKTIYSNCEFDQSKEQKVPCGLEKLESLRFKSFLPEQTWSSSPFLATPEININHPEIHEYRINTSLAFDVVCLHTSSSREMNGQMKYVTESKPITG